MRLLTLLKMKLEISLFTPLLEAIANNQFDEQKEFYIAIKGVSDCQNDDVERKLNILDCQHVLFGSIKHECIKRLFRQPGTQFCIKLPLIHWAICIRISHTAGKHYHHDFVIIDAKQTYQRDNHLQKKKQKKKTKKKKKAKKKTIIKQPQKYLYL